MPSLLDMLAQRSQGGMGGGLLGAFAQMQNQPEPQERPRPQLNLPDPSIMPTGQGPSQAPGGLGGLLGTLTGGAHDPRLSAQGNAQARKQSMIDAGLATLAGGGAGGPQGLQRIAGGMLAGRQSGAQRRSSLLETELMTRQAQHTLQTQKAKEQFRRQVMDGFDIEDPAQRAQAMSVMLENSDFEGAEKLLEFEKAFPEFQFDSTNGVATVFNARTGEVNKVEGMPDPPKDTSWQTKGRYLRLVDDQTGEVIKQIDTGGEMTAAEQASLIRQSANDAANMANTLRDDYRTETGTIRDALNDASAVLSAPEGSVNDQSLIVAYNKLLDAGSVVREGEFNRVLEAGGVLNRLKGLANRIQGKSFMDDQLREQVTREMRFLLATRQENLSELGNYYGTIAQQQGVPVNWVIRPTNFSTPSPGAPAPTTPLSGDEAGAWDALLGGGS